MKTKNFRYAILLAVAGFLTLCSCSMISKSSCSWGTTAGDKSVEVVKEDGTGTVVFNEIRQTCTNNSSGHKYYNSGYKDGAGNIVIQPQQFSAVHFISDRRAVVETSFEKGTFGLYTFAGGNTGLVEFDKNMYVRELPSRTIVGATSPRIFAGVTLSDGKLQTYDVTLISSFMHEHKVLKSLGGYNVLGNYNNKRDIIFKFMRRYGDRIVIDSVDAQSGQRQSQFLNLSGDPVTPKIGYVTEFQYLPSTVGRSQYVNRELVTSIGTFKDPHLPKEHGLQWPISITGELLPLPKGAVGVYPLFRSGGTLTGWMVFYQGTQGLEMEVREGKIASFSKEPGAGKRYTGLVFQGKRDNQGTYLARNSDNSWVVFDENRLSEFNVPGSPASLPTMTAMHTAYTTYLAKMKAQYDAERKARDDEYRARQQLALKKKQDEAIQTIKSGNICYSAHTAATAGPEYVQKYIATCKINRQDEIDALSGSGVDPSFLAKRSAEISQQAARERYAVQAAEANYQNALRAWSSVGPLNIANPGTPSAQQQRYQMEKQINQQIWNKNWDPYK